MAVRILSKLKTLKALVDALKILDLKAESEVLLPAKTKACFKGFHDLWDLLRARESQIFQRFRTRWLREGDVNSGCFYAGIKIRRQRNSILDLRVGDRWVESVHEIRAEVVELFKGRFF
jgi:hypothetical protein